MKGFCFIKKIFGKKSLKFVIAIWFLVLSLIPLFVFFIFSTSIIQNSAQKDLTSKLEAAKNVAEQSIEQYQKISLDYAKLIANITQVKEALQKKDHFRLIQIIAPLQAEMNVDLIAITDDKGILLARSDRLSENGSDWSGEYLVKCGLSRFKYTTIDKKDDMIFVESVSDVVTQMSANNMKVLGTVIVGYKIDQRMAKNIYTLTNMYPLIYINGKKEPIVIDESKKYKKAVQTEHLKKVLIGTLDSMLVKSTGKNANRYILVPIKKQTAIPVGALAIVSNDSIAQGFIKSSMKFSLALMLLTMLLVIGLSLIVANMITKPISLLANSSKKISTGEFDIELPKERSDEIGVLASEFYNMASNIKNFVANIENTVYATHDYTKKLNKIVEESEKSNRIAASQLKEVISMAEKQAQNFKQIEENIGEINNQIEYGAGAFKMMEEYSKDVIKTVQNEERSIQELIDNMFRIDETIKMLDDELQGAIKEFSNVAKTSTFISKLSEQIKLISLNASIEAAKRNIPSFGVIANEINRLSQSTDSFAKSISATVEKTLKMFDKTKNNLDKCLTIVRNGVGIANQSRKALQIIKDANSSMKSKLDQMTSSIYDQQQKILDINRAIRNQTDNTLRYFESLSSIKDTFNNQFSLVEKIINSFKTVHENISKLTDINLGSKNQLHN